MSGSLNVSERCLNVREWCVNVREWCFNVSEMCEGNVREMCKCQGDVSGYITSSVDYSTRKK